LGSGSRIEMNRVKTTRAQVICCERGFSIHDRGEQVAHVEWANVVEICAYKIDLLTYDEICIDVRVERAEGFNWVSEEDEGYSEFLDQIERRFSGIRPHSNWFGDVAYPAFAENRTTLWKRANTGG
jgi:hypothetical protein